VHDEPILAKPRFAVAFLAKVRPECTFADNPSDSAALRQPSAHRSEVDVRPCRFARHGRAESKEGNVMRQQVFAQPRTLRLVGAEGYIHAIETDRSPRLYAVGRKLSLEKPKPKLLLTSSVRIPELKAALFGHLLRVGFRKSYPPPRIVRRAFN